MKNCCDLVFVTVVQFSYGGDCGGRNSLLRRRELEEREKDDSVIDELAMIVWIPFCDW